MAIKPPGFISVIKQSALNLIFPSQDGTLFLKFSYPNAYNLIHRLSVQHDEVDAIAKKISPYSDKLSLFSMDELDNYFSTQKLTPMQLLAANELRPKDQITHDQRICKARQIFLMCQLKLHTPPSEKLATELFDPNMNQSQKADLIKAVILQDKKRYQLEKLKDTAKNFSITGSPTLSAILINPDSKRGPPKKPVIVAHFGNADCYEDHIEELNQLAKDNNCSVIGFNVRGMGLSEGKIQASSHEAVEDAKRVLKTLTTNGINSHSIELDEIVLKGESIGSAILTIAADEYSEDNHKKKSNAKTNTNIPREEPYVYNARSFSSLGFASAGFVTKNKTIGRFLGTIANGIMNALNINLNPGKAYHHLRDDRKDYLIVKKDKNDPKTRSDDVIATFASLHKDDRIQAKRRKEKEQAKEEGALEKREQIKHRHKAITFSTGSHNTSLSNLTKKQPISSSTTPTSGMTMFQDFLATAKEKTAKPRERSEDVVQETPKRQSKKTK